LLNRVIYAQTTPFLVAQQMGALMESRRHPARTTIRSRRDYRHAQLLLPLKHHSLVLIRMNQVEWVDDDDDDDVIFVCDSNQ
jgi:hypothetical protein